MATIGAWSSCCSLARMFGPTLLSVFDQQVKVYAKFCFECPVLLNHPEFPAWWEISMILNDTDMSCSIQPFLWMVGEMRCI